MPNKTIYVRDADKEIWEKAERYAGQSLSGLLADMLRKYVADKEGAEEGMERIVVDVRDENGNPKQVAFQGTWLVDRYTIPVNGIPEEGVPDMNRTVRVAKTRLGQLAIHVDDPMNQRAPKRFEVYKSLEDLSGHVPAPVWLAVAKKLGQSQGVVEELDI